ncbi:hypothetical protein KUTeg_001402 [Tegillarca granosa]|uniref:Uncharacterized protein n=1 Tax=Tegillarca granosa TaxID=220873 RepID=A0ABQ9FVQ6_TEGGR|nr:hypothetical protein KUTeg_001402 [Tegillarca granosa]
MIIPWCLHMWKKSSKAYDAMEHLSNLPMSSIRTLWNNILDIIDTRVETTTTTQQCRKSEIF